MRYYHICPMDGVVNRLSLLHIDAYRGTARVQFGYSYAEIEC